MAGSMVNVYHWEEWSRLEEWSRFILKASSTREFANSGILQFLLSKKKMFTWLLELINLLLPLFFLGYDADGWVGSGLHTPPHLFAEPKG